MPDRYRNYRALSAAERIGIDFSIETQDRETALIIATPHGGGIEPGTSEVARAIAGTNYSYYLFNGLKETGNQSLHITSSNFDEPSCRALLSSARIVIAVHAANDYESNDGIMA
jgi:phage replication-related protein YjqB (UPF0714/DUF867 family)